jgi:RND family efflux transporter MFP subunit
MKTRGFAPLLAALALLLLAGCGAKQKEPQQAEAPSGVAVRAKRIERRDVATENRVSGTVGSDDETAIYIATAAKCTAVNFQAGDAVKAGDVICSLDLGSTLASYKAAQISYNSASTSYSQQSEYFSKQIALAEKSLSDTRELFAIGAASQLEIDSLEAQLLSLRATRDSTLAQLRTGMENARSSLEQLNLALDNVDGEGNVIAPKDGTLAALNVTEGGMVSSAYPVAVVSSSAQMKVTVYVSEALVPKLSIGDEARVSVTAAPAEFTGRIRSMEQTANAQTKLYAVVIGVPEGVTGLISGMFADVTFFTDTAKETIAVPSEAILTANGEQYVFLADGGTAVRTPVTTGLTGDGVTEVLTGLSAGQSVVVAGQQYLSDGDAVRVVGEE